MSQRAFILGGSGQIGRAVASTLLDAGWDVVSGQRDPATLTPWLQARGVDAVALDRDDTDALAEAVSDGFDAVIDTVAYTDAHARQWLDLQGRFSALAVISTGSVYADDEGRTLDEARETGFPRFPVPIPETQRRTAPGEATYSTRKVAMEGALLDGARIPLAILRPFAIYGPGCRSPREWWFIARVLAGASEIPLAFDGQSRFHTSATANIAALCLAALQRGGTQVLNAADPEALTVAEIGQAILDAMGSRAHLIPFPGPPKGFRGRTPWSVEQPLVADMSAALAIGYKPVTDYHAAIDKTCEALIQAAQGRPWREAFPGLAPYPSEMFEVG
ncbi:MAG TPA: NAD-dependent epimerase/dehydratase family protein [Caulobacteraceae bacterium]|jgi:nucleoside-diphosphate-sugar epimerase|nr:NAD-dependent epimerase/dehydratase family protein [Caulobacteraceae bacterium]